MELGYVRLYRKILDNPIIWKDSDHVAIWIYLLLNATHKEISVIFKGEKTILRPGQLIVGSKAIAEDLNINYVKVHRVLNDFKVEKQIEKQASNKNSLITILNWEKYQSCEKQNEIQVKSNCNSSENKQECKECNNNTSYYSYLEEKYARMINSAEKELLDSLLETYDKDLVLEAIKQSAIMNKKNLNYAKGILRNWKKYQINNLEDLKKSEEARKEEKQPVELFSYNWLEDNE